MTSHAGDRRLADLILKVGRIHSFGRQQSDRRSIAVRDGTVVAVSDDLDGLDALRSSGTTVVEDPELTLQPAFIDSHEHLLEASRNLARVQAQDARSLEELIAMIAQRAARTPAGQWVQTSIGWNESNLLERRLPTAAELDRGSDTHPVLVPRGGHVLVANSLALQAASITAGTPDPPGGTIGHLEDGSLSGLLEGSIVHRVRGMVTPVPLQESVTNLADASRIYAGRATRQQSPARRRRTADRPPRQLPAAANSAASQRPIMNQQRCSPRSCLCARIRRLLRRLMPVVDRKRVAARSP
jgi:predicted amidohydrolase YtcJ